MFEYITAVTGGCKFIVAEIVSSAVLHVLQVLFPASYLKELIAFPYSDFQCRSTVKKRDVNPLTSS